ncbi:MAG TPA: hypothetical protein ENF20_02080 [Candidatus Marinimicrobia bacterium]|nr:hypothetical protein [Candidatus Neomarinimicrobiota bacterium]
MIRIHLERAINHKIAPQNLDKNFLFVSPKRTNLISEHCDIHRSIVWENHFEMT